MQLLFKTLQNFIRFIAFFVFLTGVVFCGLGVYDFFHSFAHVGMDRQMLGLLAVGLLHSVDLFLMAIVFFVFSVGVLVLFNHKGNVISLPDWLQIKSFTQLKVILWEAILTTLVVSFIAGLVHERADGHTVNEYVLIMPGAILLLALSLFFMKKGEGH